MKSSLISSLSDLRVFAQSLAERGHETFLLDGKLGVGKTQFVKEYVDILGGNKNSVQSPTYSYMNIYSTSSGEVLHIDMYRLNTIEDARDKGIFEAIDTYDIIFIERPQWEEHYIDSSWIRLGFQFGNPKERIITIKE